MEGGPPANRAPDISRLQGVPKGAVKPGAKFEVSSQATDPAGDPITHIWTVLTEFTGKHAHKWEALPKPGPAAIESRGARAQVTAPAKPGYLWAKDGKCHAATANMLFEVR